MVGGQGRNNRRTLLAMRAPARPARRISHPVPKNHCGPEVMPIHPICDRTLHRTSLNAEPAAFGDSLTLGGRRSHGRFLAEIVAAKGLEHPAELRRQGRSSLA